MLERVVVKRLRVLADTLLYRLYLTVFGEQQRFVFRVFLTVEIDIAVFTRGNGEHIVEVDDRIVLDLDEVQSFSHFAVLVLERGKRGEVIHAADPQDDADVFARVLLTDLSVKEQVRRERRKVVYILFADFVNLE